MTEKILHKLRQELKYHNYRYYILNDPIITDTEFDRKIHQLKALEKRFPHLEDPNSPTKVVGSDLNPNRIIMKHHSPFLSLSNCYDSKSLLTFFNQLHKVIKFSSSDSFFILEPKYDGVAIELIYSYGKLFDAVTRGDGVYGNSVLENILTINDIPKMLAKNKKVPKRLHSKPRMSIRGELIMTEEALKRVNLTLPKEKQLQNCRNTVAGSIRHNDPNITASRDILFRFYSWDQTLYHTQYEILENISNYGFSKPFEPVLYSEQYLTELSEKGTLFTMFKEIFSKGTKIFANNETVPLDGFVVKVNMLPLWKKIGMTAKYNKSAIACKWEQDSCVTTLLDVIWSVGASGILTPVGIIKPINLDGSNINNVTLYNMKKINEKGLTIGSEVSIKKGGGIIPVIDKVITSDGEKIHPPKCCPSCNSPVIMNSKGIAICSVSLDPDKMFNCQGILLSSLVNLVSKSGLDIKGFSIKLAKELVMNNKIYYPSQILNYTNEEDFLNISVTTSKKTLLKIFTQLQSVRNTGIPSYKILSLLNIPGVSTSVIKKLLLVSNDSIDNLSNFTKDELVKIPGIGKKLAINIFMFFKTSKNNQHYLTLRKYENKNKE